MHALVIDNTNNKIGVKGDAGRDEKPLANQGVRI